jgi:hypothetical protein
MKAKLLLFLLGGFLGFLVGALFRPLVEPVATELFRDESDRTEGRVVGKRLQGKRLLLTVDAAEGTILATFGKRVPEIDMLVDDGDLVTLGVRRYEPFVEDPPILAVRKQELPNVAPGGEETGGREWPGRPPGGIIPDAQSPETDFPEDEPAEPEPEPGEPETAEPPPEPAPQSPPPSSPLSS